MNFQRYPELGEVPRNGAPVPADAFKEERRCVEFGRGNGIGETMCKYFSCNLGRDHQDWTILVNEAAAGWILYSFAAGTGHHVLRMRVDDGLSTVCRHGRSHIGRPCAHQQTIDGIRLAFHFPSFLLPSPRG